MTNRARARWDQFLKDTAADEPPLQLALRRLIAITSEPAVLERLQGTVEGALLLTMILVAKQELARQQPALGAR